MQPDRTKSLFATVTQFLCTACLYSAGILVMGSAIWPGSLLVHYVLINTLIYPAALRFWLMGVSLVSAFFIYGFSLISILGLLRIVFRLNLQEGEYRVASLGGYRWMFINGLYMIAAITFMDFILLTPFSILFFRLMGAKVGKNVQINSKKCFDLSLIEIGDNTVIGGYATIMCHSFERNRLILRKVKIGKNVVLGLNSVVMSGAEIGEGAFITAGAILGKNKQVAPYSVYAGVPAESIKERRDRDKQ
ncbi:MAG: DapH/DapD/GlmU-related protein [Candidatus Omnitrophota bacterium]